MSYKIVRFPKFRIVKSEKKWYTYSKREASAKLGAERMYHYEHESF